MSKVCLFNGKSSIINDLNDLTLDVIFGVLRQSDDAICAIV